MNRTVRAVSICILFGWATCATLQADSLTLFPNSTTIDVVAAGYPIQGTFDLSKPYYAILSDSALSQSTQGYGSYTDAIGSSFTVVSPGSDDQYMFGSYAFVPGAPKGFPITGVNVYLFYTLYSVDPNSPTFDPIADYVSNEEVSASNITLVDEQPDAGPPLLGIAPEPSSWALAGFGVLSVIGLVARKLATDEHR